MHGLYGMDCCKGSEGLFGHCIHIMWKESRHCWYAPVHILGMQSGCCPVMWVCPVPVATMESRVWCSLPSVLQDDTIDHSNILGGQRNNEYCIDYVHGKLEV